MRLTWLETDAPIPEQAMADANQYQYLSWTLKQSTGRKIWLEYKLKAKWIDLASANLAEHVMHGYDLSEVNLSTAVIKDADLSEADLSDSVLSYSDLRRSCLRQAMLDRADLYAANMQEADLTDACLERAQMAKAKLAGARLVGADLSGADLREADLTGASLKYARLSGAKLAGANVSGADLTGAVLDDTADIQLLNFGEARREGRPYREFRARNFKMPTELVKTGKTARNGSGGDDRAHQNPGSTDQATTGGAGEPDLTTVAGCCAVLGISPEATIEEIVRAFRKKAKLLHPDKVRHKPPAEQERAAAEFRRVRQAYEALTRKTARPLTGILWPEGWTRGRSPYDYSVEEYEQLARLNPNNTNILYNLAWKYFEDERFSEAIEGFRRVLQINPQDADAHFNIIVVRLYAEILLPDKTGERL